MDRFHLSDLQNPRNRDELMPSAITRVGVELEWTLIYTYDALINLSGKLIPIFSSIAAFSIQHKVLHGERTIIALGDFGRIESEHKSEDGFIDLCGDFCLSPSFWTSWIISTQQLLLLIYPTEWPSQVIRNWTLFKTWQGFCDNGPAIFPQVKVTMYYFTFRCGGLLKFPLIIVAWRILWQKACSTRKVFKVGTNCNSLS